MSGTKGRLMAGVLLFAGMAFVNGPSVLGQAEPQGWSGKYSVSSVRGNYAVVATYGANLAQALGTQVADGRGHLRGSALVNQPGANGARNLSRLSFVGTYTVNMDGTGKFYLRLALPGGKTANAIEDFVITEARVLEGTPVATKMVDAQEEASHAIPGGVFVTHTYTRRP